MCAEGWQDGEVTHYALAVISEERLAFLKSAREAVRHLKSEKGYVLEEDGTTWSVNGYDNRLGFDKATQQPIGRCKLVHNHPNGTPPSLQDIEFLIQQKGRRVVVVTSGGDYGLECERYVGRAEVAAIFRRCRMQLIEDELAAPQGLDGPAKATLLWNKVREHLHELGVTLWECA